MGDEDYVTRSELREVVRELTGQLRTDTQRVYDRLGEVVESNYQVSKACALNDAANAGLHRRLDESEAERQELGRRVTALERWQWKAMGGMALAAFLAAYAVKLL